MLEISNAGWAWVDLWLLLGSYGHLAVCYLPV